MHHTIAIAVVVLTIAANAGIAAADLARARFVLATSAAVAVPPSWLPALGTLKALGAAGLLLGLLGVPHVGMVAAGGLVLFFVGAVIAHVRVKAYRTIVGPGLFLALAVAAMGAQSSIAAPPL